MSLIFDTPEDIAFFQLAARKGALGLELHGLRKRGQTAYSICKQVYGLRGSRESVYQQMEALVEAAIEAKRTERLTLELIDVEDQGVCPDGHPCKLYRTPAADVPFLRVCDNADPHGPDGFVPGPFRSMPLIRWSLTLEELNAALAAGANTATVEWAALTLRDREAK